jgi:hypothetical protein
LIAAKTTTAVAAATSRHSGCCRRYPPRATLALCYRWLVPKRVELTAAASIAIALALPLLRHPPLRCRALPLLSPLLRYGLAQS